MKNGVHSTVTALPAAESFKTPAHANQMTRDVTLWTQIVK